MADVRVNLSERSYSIRIGRGMQPEITATKAAVAFDANVKSIADSIISTLKSRGINASSIAIPAGEASKSLAMVQELYNLLAAMNADRRTPVIAIGGGVVGDLAGFAAATYNRGLPMVMVPTTLLAMVDSSVGGKTGVNLPAGKNLVGAFHQPQSVIIDLNALATLPDREYQSGLAEVVKYGMILDEPFFAWLEHNAEPILQRDGDCLEHLIARCCELKARVVEQDEREETGLRAVLNYGHTFGHAFETLGGYSRWLHGEAVSLGMACAAKLAFALGRVDASFVERQSKMLERFGLPITMPEFEADAVIAVMRKDKKNLAGKLRFVLPSRIGRVELVDGIEDAVVRTVLESP